MRKGCSSMSSSPAQPRILTSWQQICTLRLCIGDLCPYPPDSRRLCSTTLRRRNETPAYAKPQTLELRRQISQAGIVSALFTISTPPLVHNPMSLKGLIAALIAGACNHGSVQRRLAFSMRAVRWESAARVATVTSRQLTGAPWRFTTGADCPIGREALRAGH